MPQAVQAAWPATAAKLCAAQTAQTVLDVAVHAPLAAPLATAEPAGQAAHGAHGEVPEALHVEPATQPVTVRHEWVGTSQ